MFRNLCCCTTSYMTGLCLCFVSVHSFGICEERRQTCVSCQAGGEIEGDSQEM
jgi:hypothetical protein